jgi:hypothetical protein
MQVQALDLKAAGTMAAPISIRPRFGQDITNIFF